MLSTGFSAPAPAKQAAAPWWQFPAPLRPPPLLPTSPGCLHKTCLFGIDGGDLGDSSHLDHPSGVLPQLQVPQGRVQQVPDHLIVDLMEQVG